MESIGLDGSIFANPLEWPSVKSLMAGINFAGALMSKAGPQQGGSQGGFANGVADAVGLGGLMSAIPGVNPAVAGGQLDPAMNAPGVNPGSGAGPGSVDNSININGNMGMDPAAVKTSLRTEQAARTRTTVMQ